MIIDFLLVGAGGSIGVLLRVLCSTLAKKFFGTKFPWGTFLINIVGSFLIGFAGGHNLQGTEELFFMTGMIGAFTTFSTFNYESIALLRVKKYLSFFIYVVGTYLICMSMTGLGYLVSK